MIHEAWFKFNGIDSRRMGIRVTKMPETIRAERRMESITIPGRSGSLHQDGEAYESYTRTMECAIIRRERLDEIAAWLVGSGEMIFSTEPDKVYRVMISNKISIAQMMRTFQRFMVSMDTQPFKYNVTALDDTRILTAPTKLFNSGTVFSEPTITVYGTGDITLTINGEDFPLTGIDGSITIDSERMEAFKDAESQNSKYGGLTFPRLEVGENDVNWTGNVEKIVIIPNWRWL